MRCRNHSTRGECPLPGPFCATGARTVTCWRTRASGPCPAHPRSAPCASSNLGFPIVPRCPRGSSGRDAVSVVRCSRTILCGGLRYASRCIPGPGSRPRSFSWRRGSNGTDIAGLRPSLLPTLVGAGPEGGRSSHALPGRSLADSLSTCGNPWSNHRPGRMPGRATRSLSVERDCRWYRG